MDCTASFLPYGQTGYFSKIIVDYLNEAPGIQPFYSHPVTIDGIRSSIANRNQFNTDRSLLVNALKQQYAHLPVNEQVKSNITLLQSERTFTVCTAHQPNIFTGPLYFIYKILHAVKLAEELKTQFPENDFVPVYYMGSEDADLDELGHIYIAGEKYQWNTSQTGAVGRMVVDKALLNLLDSFSGQLQVHPSGNEIIGMMKECYTVGATIEQATFQLVHKLFAEYGVVTLLPDNASLKAAFIPIIKKELLEGFSHTAVQETISAYPADYKVQASGRELNMFYLTAGKRERIELLNNVWSIVNTKLTFTQDEMISELEAHPERFSPNVILRPAFQEFILPNIAFIGGGGEIAYWLQLKKVFEAVDIPYPVLVLRNSFVYVPTEIRVLIEKLKFSHLELFRPEREIMNGFVKRESSLQLSLSKELQELRDFYLHIKTLAGNIDPTLKQHVEALETMAIKKLASLEKKMLRAEKRKFEAQQRQLQKIKAQLFPHNNLQERIDNLMPYYAKWGNCFIKTIYDHSHGLRQEFGILAERASEPVKKAVCEN